MVITVVSQKRAHYGLSARPQFFPNFLLRFKNYLKERPLCPSVAYREFPLSSKPEDVVRLVYTHYKVQITQMHSGLL